MEILPIVFSVVLIVLTIVLSIVGVQVVMILMEIKKTLRKANETLDLVEDKIHAIANPFQNLGGALSGIKTGMQFFESFSGWLNKGKKSEDEDQSEE